MALEATLWFLLSNDRMIVYDAQDIGVIRWSSEWHHENFLSWVKQREYRWKLADLCGHPSHSYRNICNNNHPCFSG